MPISDPVLFACQIDKLRFSNTDLSAKNDNRYALSFWSDKITYILDKFYIEKD